MTSRLGKVASLVAAAATTLALSTSVPTPVYSAGVTYHPWSHDQSDATGETTAKYDIQRVMWRNGQRFSATLHLGATPSEWYSHVDLEIGDEPVFLVLWAKGHSDGTTESEATLVTRDADVPRIHCHVRVGTDDDKHTIRLSVSNDCLRTAKHHQRYADWFVHGAVAFAAVGRATPERFDRTKNQNVPRP